MKFHANKLTKPLLSLLTVALLSVVAPLAQAGGDIAFSGDQIYPESVAWSNSQHAFLVSSIVHGQIGKVTMNGTYTPFITDPKLVSSLGVLADEKRNTLWVAVADPGKSVRSTPETAGKLAAVAAYNLTTGEPRGYYDLGHLSPGAHLANDLTLDAEGNLYVTDSFSPIIYRVDTAGNASIFARNDAFEGKDFNLNGIVYLPDGHLLVDKDNSGELFRIDVKDPGKIERVQLPAPFKGADGLRLVDSKHLMLVQNLGTDQTIELVSQDGWKSATIERKEHAHQSMPTAAVKVGKDVYVLNSRIDNLFDKDAARVNDFSLQKF